MSTERIENLTRTLPVSNTSILRLTPINYFPVFMKTTLGDRGIHCCCGNSKDFCTMSPNAVSLLTLTRVVRSIFTPRVWSTAKKKKKKNHLKTIRLTSIKTSIHPCLVGFIVTYNGIDPRCQSVSWLVSWWIISNPTYNFIAFERSSAC